MTKECFSVTRASRLVCVLSLKTLLIAKILEATAVLVSNQGVSFIQNVETYKAKLKLSTLPFFPVYAQRCRLQITLPALSKANCFPIIYIYEIQN